MINSMDENIDKEEIIQALQNSNNALRQKALIIFLFLISAFGIYRLYDSQIVENEKLFDKILLLDKMKDAPDLKKYIEDNRDMISMEFMHTIIDGDALIYILEQNNYMDRTAVVEAITKINEQRTKLFNNDGTINIIGISIQISSLLSVWPFVLAFFFQHLTHVVYFRKKLVTRMQELGIESYKLGIDFLSNSRVKEKTTVGNYLKLISSAITGFFLIVSLFAALFLVGFFMKDLHSVVLTALSCACFLVILIDILIIIYEEDIMRLGYIIDFVSGNGDSTLKEDRMRAAALINFPVFMTALYTILGDENNNIIPCLITVAFMATFLSVSLWLCYISPNNRLFVAMRFVGIIVNMFWFSFIMIFLIGWTRYTDAVNPYEVIQLAFAIFLAASILSIFYVKVIYIEDRD